MLDKGIINVAAVVVAHPSTTPISTKGETAPAISPSITTGCAQTSTPTMEYIIWKASTTNGPHQRMRSKAGLGPTCPAIPGAPHPGPPMADPPPQTRDLPTLLLVLAPLHRSPSTRPSWARPGADGDTPRRSEDGTRR